MILRFRYYCACRWKGNDSDVALYHAITLGHRVEIADPKIPWRTDYLCGCWCSAEESHACKKHARG